MRSIDPGEIVVSCGDNLTVEKKTSEEIEEFREGYLNDA